jgi:hypothetical protein
MDAVLRSRCCRRTSLKVRPTALNMLPRRRPRHRRRHRHHRRRRRLSRAGAAFFCTQEAALRQWRAW